MIGANPLCSRLSGVRNDRVIILVYTLTGLLAALTAIVLTMDMSAASLNLGADFSMDSIAATAVGGTSFAGGIGGVEGTISGVLIIRLITSLLQKANVVNCAKLIVQSGIILAVVALYPRKEKRYTLPDKDFGLRYQSESSTTSQYVRLTRIPPFGLAKIII